MPTFTEIVNNDHFQNLAALVRLGYIRSWRLAHRELPFWTLLDEVTATINPAAFASNRQQFLLRFSRLIETLRHATEQQPLAETDLAWLAGMLDGDYALVTASMLMAYASATDRYVTPAEVAAATGTAESTWRNNAAAGTIPGAIKKGKQWLFPVSVLRARGVVLPREAGEPVDPEPPEDAEPEMTDAEYSETMRQLNPGLN